MLGEAAGFNFKIDPYQTAAGQGGAQYQYGAGMPMDGAPEMANIGDLSGLQFVEGMTSDVYDKYHKLNNFVSAMWKNYGIDVTKPNFDSDIGVKANQLYQKAIADLHFTVQDLKTSQAMLPALVQQANQHGGFETGFDLTQQPLTRLKTSPIRDNKLLPETQEMLKTYQKGFGSQSEVEMANQALAQQKEHLMSMRAQAEAAGDTASVEDIDANLSAIQQAWYDEGLDKKLENAREIARLRAYATMNRPTSAQRNQAQTDINAVYNSWATGQGQDPDLLLKNLFGTNGEPLFTKIWRSQADQSTYAVTQDGSTVKFPHGDKNFLFSYLAKFDPNWSKITGPLLDISEGNVPRITPTGESYEKIEPDQGLQKEVGKAKTSLMAGSVDGKTQAGANHLQVIENLNSKALQGRLMIPPDIQDALGGGETITKVWQAGWSDDVVKITTDLGREIKLHLDKKEDRKTLERLIEGNDVTLNPGYIPKGASGQSGSGGSAPKGSGTNIVPMQLEGPGIDNAKYDYYYDEANDRYFYAEKGKRSPDGKIKAIGIVNVR